MSNKLFYFSWQLIFQLGDLLPRNLPSLMNPSDLFA